MARTDDVGAALRAARGGVSAVPLLMGLVAVTAVEVNLGKAAADALAAVKEKDKLNDIAAAQRERQRSAPVAAQEATRPVWDAIPPEAWGADAR